MLKKIFQKLLKGKKEPLELPAAEPELMLDAAKPQEKSLKTEYQIVRQTRDAALMRDEKGNEIWIKK